MYPKATSEFIPVCREVAAGLQEGDGGAHLISVHPDPSVASSRFIHSEDWLAFNMIQTCIDYDQIHAAVTADYARAPAKPVVMAEGGYEGLEFGKLQTPHHIRMQAYWTQLAGGHHVYGHNEAWRKPLDWQEWLDAPGSQQLTQFKEIVTSLDGWWEMIPDQSIFLSGEGSGYRLNMAARSTSGGWILAYLSEACTFSIRLDSINASRRGRAFWINPVSGERQPVGIYQGQDTPSLTTLASWPDALLLLEAM
jgi:hypothetical protein